MLSEGVTYIENFTKQRQEFSYIQRKNQPVCKQVTEVGTFRESSQKKLHPGHWKHFYLYQ